MAIVSPPPCTDVQVLVDLGLDARRHERRRVELVDHGGAFEARAGRQVVALVDGRVARASPSKHTSRRLGRLGHLAAALVLAGSSIVRGLAGGHELQPVELDGRVVAAVGELALVLGVELLDGRVQVAVATRPPSSATGRGSAWRSSARGVTSSSATPSDSSSSRPSASRRSNASLELVRVGVVGGPQEHLRQVVADVDHQAAERRPGAGARRDEHGRHAQLLRERGAVQRAGAAERDERELARVVAALERDDPHGVGHVRVGDGDDRLGGRVQRRGPAARATVVRIASSAASRSSVMPPPTSCSPSRPSTRLASVFVGSSPPLPYAAGPGSEPADCGPLRSEPAASIVASEPPPAPIVSTSIDGKQIGWPYSTNHSLVVRSCAVVDEARCRCSCRPCRRRSRSRGRTARRCSAPPPRPRRCRTRPAGRRAPAPPRASSRRRRSAGSAGRPRSRRPSGACRVVDVVGHERRQDGVGDGGREALVLEQLGQDAGRGGDASRRAAPRAGSRPCAARGRRWRRRSRSTPRRSRPRAGPRMRATSCASVLVELGDHLAALVDALGHLEPVAAPDVRRGVVLVGVPQVVARAAADLHHVAEPASCRPSPPSAGGA